MTETWLQSLRYCVTWFLNFDLAGQPLWVKITGSISGCVAGVLSGMWGFLGR